MSPITTTTVIDRPAAEVFSYATDPTRFSEWQSSVVAGHMDETDPGAVGSKCFTTRRIGGATRSVTAELTHIDPPTTWGIRGIDGPIRATVDVTVEPITCAQSRLTIAIEFHGHGIGRVLVPLLVRRGAEQEMPGNLARLKQRLEGRIC